MRELSARALGLALNLGDRRAVQLMGEYAIVLAEWADELERLSQEIHGEPGQGE